MRASPHAAGGPSAEVAVHVPSVPGSTTEDDSHNAGPSWALHLPTQGDGTLYYKHHARRPTVDVFHLGSEAPPSSIILMEGSATLTSTSPDFYTAPLQLWACTGDGKLVCAAGPAEQQQLQVLDPAPPPADDPDSGAGSDPPASPGDQHAHPSSVDKFEDGPPPSPFRYVPSSPWYEPSSPVDRAVPPADGPDSGDSPQPPPDSFEGHPTFCNLQHAAVGPKGEVWAWDNWGASLTRIVRVPLGLVPPAALDPASGALLVAGSTTDLAQNFGALLASGAGADVVIQAAGGQSVCAHSHVLAARWPWWHGPRNRWQADGTKTSASVVTVLQDLPVAVVRAFLQFLYTGQAVVEGRQEQGQQQGVDDGGGAVVVAGQQGHGHEQQGPATGCSNREQEEGGVHDDQPLAPAAKRARQDSGGSSAGASTAAQPQDTSAASDSTSDMVPHIKLLQLLHAAQAYEVPQLHAACLEAARAHISVHSALQWLVYADQHNEAELQEMAMAWAGAQHAGT